MIIHMRTPSSPRSRGPGSATIEGFPVLCGKYCNWVDEIAYKHLLRGDGNYAPDCKKVPTCEECILMWFQMQAEGNIRASEPETSQPTD